MQLPNLYRRFCQAMTAAAFAEAGEQETARMLLEGISRPMQRKGRAPLGKRPAEPTGAGNPVAQTDFS